MMKMKDRIGILKEFRMDKIPRAVGNPRQHIVTRPKQFIQFFRFYNGKTPLYTSHNSYPSLTKHFNPKTVKIRNIFLDFDKKEDGKFKTVSHDTQLVSDFLSDHDICHTIAFSGRQGYHIYIQLKGTEEALMNGISLKYRSIYAYLRRQLSLKTLDMQCAEPKRLCRVPTSTYVKKDNKTERMTRPVPRGMAIPTTENQAYEFSKGQPTSEVFQRGNKILTIDEFMDEFEISPETMDDEEMYDTVSYEIPQNKYLEVVGEFFRPCIRNSIFTHNPPHFSRLASCIKIKRIDYSKKKTKKFFDRLSQEAGWVDRQNKDKRDRHIDSIYKKNYHISCRRIKLEGHCIGEDCEYYEVGLDKDDESDNE